MRPEETTTGNTGLTRRRFLTAPLAAVPALGSRQPELRLWAFSDAHVGTDKRHGRDSLAEALAQSESGAFDWDIALDLGDHSGAQGLPEDEEGREIARQFGVLKQHRREDIFSVCGNHDRSGLREAPNWWWRKWLDPTGENTAHSRVNAARRRFPVEGTWERYSFRVGKFLFLMMSDINEPSQKVGRGTLGGNPGGVVSGETFAWWKQMVESNRDSIIVSAHHYIVRTKNSNRRPRRENMAATAADRRKNDVHERDMALERWGVRRAGHAFLKTVQHAACCDHLVRS